MKKTAKIGVASVLTIIFVVLKLLRVISWPWLWVLSPIWIPTILAILIFLFASILQKIVERM